MKIIAYMTNITEKYFEELKNKNLKKILKLHAHSIKHTKAAVIQWEYFISRSINMQRQSKIDYFH